MGKAPQSYAMHVPSSEKLLFAVGYADTLSHVCSSTVGHMDVLGPDTSVTSQTPSRDMLYS
jgi:hypothetical protein